MTDFDRSPLVQIRDDIRDLVSIPLQAWMLIPPQRRRDEHFASLMTIPLDLAAAGFAVTVTQDDRGWHVDLKKTVAPKVRLHLLGEARSYVSALYQLADSSDLALRDLEKTAKRHWRESQAEEAA